MRYGSALETRIEKHHDRIKLKRWWGGGKGEMVVREGER